MQSPKVVGQSCPTTFFLGSERRPGRSAIAFSLFLLFQLVTLPVDFNASARAKQLVVEAGIVLPQERTGIDKVLNAAAMTYIAAFVSSLLTLLYFLYKAGLLGNRR